MARAGSHAASASKPCFAQRPRTVPPGAMPPADQVLVSARGANGLDSKGPPRLDQREPVPGPSVLLLTGAFATRQRGRLEVKPAVRAADLGASAGRGHETEAGPRREGERGDLLGEGRGCLCGGRSPSGTVVAVQEGPRLGVVGPSRCALRADAGGTLPRPLLLLEDDTVWTDAYALGNDRQRRRDEGRQERHHHAAYHVSPRLALLTIS